MKHPPYHLRPNKAVDRMLLMEVLKILDRISDIENYTYLGFGGPYLDEFRMVYELFPNIKMISIEENEDTLKRQDFHLPCGSLRLVHDRFSSFLTQYDASDLPAIYWLDYTSLSYGNFEDFMSLLNKSCLHSLIKISLRSNPTDYYDAKRTLFARQFEALMPDPSLEIPRTNMAFASLLQNMLRIAAQKALPAASGKSFQPVSSFFYSDGTGMLTLTGIVCDPGKLPEHKKIFKGWPFANLDWHSPLQIDVPILSTKERLLLEKYLPCKNSPGATLQSILGYRIDDDQSRSKKKLKQYASFHRYSPYFVRAVP
jgi:hypothetical protein